MTATFREIITAVSCLDMPSGGRVLPREITSHYRARAIVDARFLTCFLAHTLLRDPSYPKIGRLVGRDHGTVMHAVREVKRRWNVFAPLVAQAEALIAEAREHDAAMPLPGRPPLPVRRQWLMTLRSAA